jgi:hypothetical protein
MNTPAVLPSVETFLTKPGRMLIGKDWVGASSGESIDATTSSSFPNIGVERFSEWFDKNLEGCFTVWRSKRAAGSKKGM